MSYTFIPQHILVMEPHVDGHHGPYLRWMTEGFSENGKKTTIITFPESIHHPSLHDIGSTIPDNTINIVGFKGGNCIKKHQKNSSADLIRREFAYWWLFRSWYLRQVKKEKPDIIFLPYLDYCFYAFGLLGSPFGNTPWMGVAMRPSFHYQEVGITAPKPAFHRLKKKLFWRLLKDKKLKYLITIDETLINYIHLHSGSDGRVRFLPEPCKFEEKIDTRKAKKKLGIDPSKKVILVYGSITSRKGVAELLKAIKQPACPRLVDVILAGKISDDVLSILDESWAQELKNERRLIVFNHYISDKEEQTLFSASDIAWLGYLNHYGPSSVLIQAAAVGLPVISCEGGILGWQTKRHNLGVVVCPTDIDSVVNGIRMLVENKNQRIVFGTSGQKTFGRNTIDRAKNMLVEAISSQVTGS